MIVHDSWWQTEACAQLSPTIIDYHEPFDQGLRVANIKANFPEKTVTKNNKIYNNLLTTILYNIYKLWLKEIGLYVNLKALK